MSRNTNTAAPVINKSTVENNNSSADRNRFDIDLMSKNTDNAIIGKSNDNSDREEVAVAVPTIICTNGEDVEDELTDSSTPVQTGEDLTTLTKITLQSRGQQNLTQKVDDLKEASWCSIKNTRQSRGQQTSGSKSSWRSRPSESPPLRGLMAQREATQRAQRNVMNVGTKRSFMSSMNMNRTPFSSEKNNSTARSFQPPSPPFLMNRNTMTTNNSRGIETLSKSCPDNKRQKKQSPQEPPQEEVTLCVDNLDLGEI